MASVLRREAADGTRLLIIFGAGSDKLVPSGWYGTDLVGEYLNDGWGIWYVIHNHTTQKNGDRLALGAPVPSTNDVELNRSLAVQLGVDSLPASVLRREAADGTRLLIIFGAGSDKLVPSGWYGTDLVGEYLNDGWGIWYVIHNHTTQKNGDRLALGAPVPSTNDVELNRSLAVQLGVDSVRVTNGFYTFRASTGDMSQFRAR